jgi:protein involved in polysaccharide export with SLBB domain
MKPVLSLTTLAVCAMLPACLMGLTHPVSAQPAGNQSVNTLGNQSVNTQRVVAMTDTQRRAYVLQVGDLINIEVPRHEELSANLQVLGDGYVRVPGGKPLLAAGRAIWQVEKSLRTDLAQRIASPNPKIQLLKRADIIVTIGGEVRETGRKTLSAESRLQDVIAEAGGITTEKPEWHEAVITRKGRVLSPVVLSNILSNVLIDANLELMDGDSVLIRRRPLAQTHVNVAGPGVRSPGSFPFPADRSVLSAISAAGGFLPDASLVRGEILRGSDKISVDFTKEGSTLRSVELRPNDTLYIPINPYKFTVNGAVNQVGPKSYPENETLTVMRAIAMSGGVQMEIADLKNAKLTRASSDGKNLQGSIKVDLDALLRKNNLSKDIEMRPGDILNIPTKKPKRSFDILDALQIVPIFILLRQAR